MEVIGLGLGRTGTYSLKFALEKLGFGPCHHMEEVVQATNVARQVALWAAALDGHADWAAIYKGYRSAVDWPTAGFPQELVAAYPSARFILTIRDPQSWAESFSQTLGLLLAQASPGEFPPERRDWLDMTVRVFSRSGFPPGLLDVPALMAAFTAHNDAVRAAVPPDRLLVFQVKEGWAPLCRFLAVPVPTEPFPHENERLEFMKRVTGGA